MSQVKELQYSGGIDLKVDSKAACTDSASFPANLRIIVKRDFLSTNVAMCVFFEPDTKSPSQCPSDLRLSIFLERSCIDTPLIVLMIFSGYASYDNLFLNSSNSCGSANSTPKCTTL